MRGRRVMLLLLLVAGAPGAPADLSFGLTGRLPEETRALVERAVDLVGDPACGGAVLSRFGVSPSGPPHLILRATVNRDVCPRSSVLATTTRGGVVVNLCMPDFAAAVVREPEVALVVLIHELLHTRGLGETPIHPGAPTSAEISRAVEETCDLTPPG